MASLELEKRFADGTLGSTTFLRELRGLVLETQESAESDGRKVRSCERIERRGHVLATIYGKSRSYLRARKVIAGARD